MRREAFFLDVESFLCIIKENRMKHTKKQRVYSYTIKTQMPYPMVRRMAPEVLKSLRNCGEKPWTKARYLLEVTKDNSLNNRLHTWYEFKAEETPLNYTLTLIQPLA